MSGKGIHFITKEEWEAMGVIYGTYISEREASILDNYAVDHMMTREEAAKAILRAATIKGEPPRTVIPPREIDGVKLMLNMMMPRPIYRFIQDLTESLEADWNGQVLRAFILDVGVAA